MTTTDISEFGNRERAWEEFKAAMMNGKKLESWYSCPECGHEGFAEDMMHNEDDDNCREYLVGIGVIEEADND